MTIPVVLVLDTGDGDEEHAEEQLQHLIAELSELDLDSIDRVTQGPPPPGSRSTEAVQLGALILALGGSGALLLVLAAVVQDWLNRRRSGSVRLKIGEDEIEPTGASDEVQRRALEAFLRRHGD
ncbi:effector-associated constant component EACC1 [Streptomyces longwoodensis]|uniref:effector-associated constant component EACC1 n=1 Tax=Streptomyces longwoodensis TaxID=68231 RepID=UPI002250742B|nr:hypothetical protein [Streptomyces longwoodensis]MCX5000345.1 hypothetical protein [Streptomyces longwoodensis]